MNNKGIALQQLGIMILLLFSAVLVGYVLYEVFFGSLAEQSYNQIDAFTEGLSPGEREIISRIANVPPQVNLFYYSLLTAFRNVEAKQPLPEPTITLLSAYDEEELHQDGTFHVNQNEFYVLTIQTEQDDQPFHVTYTAEGRSFPDDDSLLVTVKRTEPKTYHLFFRPITPGKHTISLMQFDENQMLNKKDIVFTVIRDPDTVRTGVIALSSTPSIPHYRISKTELQEDNFDEEIVLTPNNREGFYYVNTNQPLLLKSWYGWSQPGSVIVPDLPNMRFFIRSLRGDIDVFPDQGVTSARSSSTGEIDGQDRFLIFPVPANMFAQGLLGVEVFNPEELQEIYDVDILDQAVFFTDFDIVPLGKMHPTRKDCLVSYFNNPQISAQGGSLFYDSGNYNVHLWQSGDEGVYIELQEGSEPVPNTREFIPGKTLCVVGGTSQFIAGNAVAQRFSQKFIQNNPITANAYATVEDIVIAEETGAFSSSHPVLKINYGSEQELFLRDYGLVYIPRENHVCLLGTTNEEPRLGCDERNPMGGNSAFPPVCVSDLQQATKFGIERKTKTYCIDWENPAGATP